MTPRAIRVLFQKDWAASERRGLLAPDPRVRTLCRVLVTYPEVRHIVPDRISLDGTTDAALLRVAVERSFTSQAARRGRGLSR